MKLAEKMRRLFYRTVQRLYWMTRASDTDPLLKEGAERIWLDGYMTDNPRFKREESIPPDRLN